jgi:hypothetical protein
MDASAVRAAYARLIDAARDLEGVAAPAGEWGPDLVLAHVIVADRLVAEAAARALAGNEPGFDNRASQSAPYLQAIVRGAGDWDGLLDAVRRGGEELAAVVERIGPEHAGTMIPSYVVDGGRVVVDAPIPLEQLVVVPATLHTPGHCEHLESLRVRPS